LAGFCAKVQIEMARIAATSEVLIERRVVMRAS
jgi:hypothetical protein